LSRPEAEAIRAGIEESAIEHAGSPFGHVTASIGMAAVLPASDNEPSAAIAEADAAVYRAKAGGRNRVEC
jgi:diguanylate cyclase (GGDEF)-like protein